MPEPVPPPLPGQPPAAPPARALWRQSMDAHDDLDEGETRERRGIGGWLLLFTLGRVLAIPLLGFVLLKNLLIIFKPGVWQALTTPGSAAYDPFWSPAIVYETAGNALLLLANIVIVCLLFAQWKILRPVMVGYLAAIVLFYWGDYFLGQRIHLLSDEVHHQSLMTALVSTLNAAVWVPYWLVSERVKGTFYK